MAAQAAAAPSENIIVYGDARTNHDIHRKIVGHILTFRPQAVFSTGDQVNDGRVAGRMGHFQRDHRPHSQDLRVLSAAREPRAQCRPVLQELPASRQRAMVFRPQGPHHFLHARQQLAHRAGIEPARLAGKGAPEHPEGCQVRGCRFSPPDHLVGTLPGREKPPEAPVAAPGEVQGRSSCLSGTSTSTSAPSKTESPTSQPGAAGRPCTSKLRHNPYGQVFRAFTIFVSCRWRGRPWRCASTTRRWPSSMSSG